MRYTEHRCALFMSKVVTPMLRAHGLDRKQWADVSSGEVLGVDVWVTYPGGTIGTGLGLLYKLAWMDKPKVEGWVCTRFMVFWRGGPVMGLRFRRA